jgi:hypothetical protein
MHRQANLICHLHCGQHDREHGDPLQMSSLKHISQTECPQFSTRGQRLPSLYGSTQMQQVACGCDMNECNWKIEFAIKCMLQHSAFYLIYVDKSAHGAGTNSRRGVRAARRTPGLPDPQPSGHENALNIIRPPSSLLSQLMFGLKFRQ